jgi:transcription-repair coupling factor (superfamily II helicase)
VKAVARTFLVPRPTTARVAGQPLRDAALLAWCIDLVQAVLATDRATDRATPA